MNFELTPDQNEFRGYVATYVDERVLPRAAELDAAGVFPHEIFRELGELGYLGMRYPGGSGDAEVAEPNIYHTIFCEELARGSLGVAAVVGVHTSTATYCLHKFGSDALKERYLEPALRGEKIAAFALTESGAGSDVSAISTRAEFRDGGYVLKGRKMFISNATVADFSVVAAKVRTAPDPVRTRGAAMDGADAGDCSRESTGGRDLSLFLVDMRSPGVSVGRKLEKLSIRCSETAEIVLDDVWVPADQLLGAEGAGFDAILDSLDIDRLMTAAMCSGLARTALDVTRSYVKERVQFGRPISAFQAVRFRLVDMLTRLEMARLCTYRAAWLADQGRRITLEAALAKNVAGEAARDVAAMAVATFGGYGLMSEYPVERLLRDSYFPLVGGGTVDIMKIIVAKEMGL